MSDSLNKFYHKYSKISHLENIFQKHNKLFTGINRIRCVVWFVVYIISPPHIYFTSNFRHNPKGFETNIFRVHRATSVRLYTCVMF